MPTAVSGGFTQDFLSAMDGRCRNARELRARWRALASSQGGEANLSYMRRSLIDRFIHVEAWLEGQEEALAQGKEIDVSRYFNGLNSFVSLLNRLGLQRKRKELPSLHEYLNGRGTGSSTGSTGEPEETP